MKKIKNALIIFIAVFIISSSVSYATTRSDVCKNICSGTLSQWGYSIFGFGDCASKCAKNGCYWENDICTSTPTICKIGEKRANVFDQGTVEKRLELAKNGFKNFVLKDPLCDGPNCAKYVTRAHEYVFGIGKHFITGVGGNAWDLPENIENRDGTVRWFDWRKGEIFSNYDSLLPGDLIGFYYSESLYRSNRELGMSSGNTPDLDFTHVALYLGKINNMHIITHLYHAPEDGGNNNKAVRTESLEYFLQKYSKYFKIRVVMRPNQERLYRAFDKNSIRDYNTVQVEAGSSLSNMIGFSLKKEEYEWVTANINSMVENVNTDKYAGKAIKVPQNLPATYTTDMPELKNYKKLLSVTTKLIEKRSNDVIMLHNVPYEWAFLAVKNAPAKTPEDVALMLTIIEHEGSYYSDSQGVGEFLVRPFTVEKRSYSVGCMNIQLCKAENIAKDLGRDENVYDVLRTTEGCTFYGGQWLKIIMASQQASSNRNEISDDKVAYILNDYIKRDFWLRNAQFQLMINDLLGPETMVEVTGDRYLELDGALQAYDDNCNIRKTVTKTEKAMQKVASLYKLGIANSEIKNSLLLEKTENFEKTAIYRGITRLWAEKYGLSTPIQPEDVIKKHPEFLDYFTFLKKRIDTYKYYEEGIKVGLAA